MLQPKFVCKPSQSLAGHCQNTAKSPNSNLAKITQNAAEPTFQIRTQVWADASGILARLKDAERSCAGSVVATAIAAGKTNAHNPMFLADFTLKRDAQNDVAVACGRHTSATKAW